ncbi:MAG: DUF3473 domain-containing protein [Magnetococcales bacterium]|nr:DUF3473 domain-containing protein [Magnetococcales bacterium]NGZ05414.1 DUF3473 domain-containing protein [Magnetococcales bacterium]
MVASVVKPCNALTVDVEEYFQVAALAPYIERQQWDRLSGRVAESTWRVLNLLARHEVKATFFVLGWVAQHHPDLVRAIVASGHELASHGMEHIRVTQQSPEEFLADARRSRDILEEVGGVAVRGYRASTYSIGKRNPWAFDVLNGAGYKYSSSVYPIRHDLYGWPEAPRGPFWPSGVAGQGIVEIPVATLPMGGRCFPCGGGGFFRLYPYWFSRWAWQRVQKLDEQPGPFYFHPWELDPDQPRVAGIGWKTRVRHYLNLRRMEGRLDMLLRDFCWERMERVYASLLRDGSA